MSKTRFTSDTPQALFTAKVKTEVRDELRQRINQLIDQLINLGESYPSRNGLSFYGWHTNQALAKKLKELSQHKYDSADQEPLCVNTEFLADLGDIYLGFTSTGKLLKAMHSLIENSGLFEKISEAKNTINESIAKAIEEETKTANECDDGGGLSCRSKDWTFSEYQRAAASLIDEAKTRNNSNTTATATMSPHLPKHLTPTSGPEIDL